MRTFELASTGWERGFERQEIAQHLGLVNHRVGEHRLTVATLQDPIGHFNT
jgi:hypothetical protein